MESVHTVGRYLDGTGYQHVSLSRTAVGHLQTVAAINGRGVRLLIDTGAAATVIDRESALRLDLVTVATSSSAEGHPECGLSESSVESTMLGELALGAIVLQEVEARVLDLSSINRRLEEAGAEPVDGILGADLMERHKAIIGYAEKELYLRDAPPS